MKNFLVSYSVSFFITKYKIQLLKYFWEIKKRSQILINFCGKTLKKKKLLKSINFSPLLKIHQKLKDFKNFFFLFFFAPAKKNIVEMDSYILILS